MPQLDTLSFFTQYVWITFAVVFFLTLSCFYIYPLLVKNLLARSHSEDFSSSTTSSTLDVSLISNNLWN